MANKDCVFHINWNLHRIGTLAWVDEYFYLMQREKENLEEACADGYNGIPGFDFEREEIYRSKELFKYFLRRTLKKTPEEQCKDLKVTGGKSLTDSFSLSEVKLTEKEMGAFKERIISRYKKIQAEKDITK